MVIKVNICMPKDILDQLDDLARESNLSRSALLSQAAKRLLEEKNEEKRRQRRVQAAERIMQIAEEIGPWDGTSEILKWRDKH